MVSYGTPTLQETHYKTDKLEDFTFLAMETKNKIILIYLASNRLSLTEVLCHNTAKKCVEMLKGLEGLFLTPLLSR